MASNEDARNTAESLFLGQIEKATGEKYDTLEEYLAWLVEVSAADMPKVGHAEGEPVILTSKDDDYWAREFGEYIDSGAGDDYVVGSNGDDDVHAGEGDDSVLGYNGDDFLMGYSGDDYILGGFGDDTAAGHEGDDTIDGGEGEDFISGFEGDDLLVGGADSDWIEGGDGNDVIVGFKDTFYFEDAFRNYRAEVNVLIGGAGDDTIRGGLASDIVSGGTGADSISTGIGADVIYSAMEAGPTIAECSDVFDFGWDIHSDFLFIERHSSLDGNDTGSFDFGDDYLYNFGTGGGEDWIYVDSDFELRVQTRGFETTVFSIVDTAAADVVGTLTVNGDQGESADEFVFYM